MENSHQFMDAVISLRGVTKSFGSHTVLRDISRDIPRGQITAVTRLRAR